ncbi:MAG: hypothetical protein RLN85_08185, partial [Pseudomonadales bacterium]
YLLLRSLSTLKLSDLIYLIENPADEKLSLPGTSKAEAAQGWWKKYAAMVAEEHKQSEQLFDITLEQLFLTDKDKNRSIS